MTSRAQLTASLALAVVATLHVACNGSSPTTCVSSRECSAAGKVCDVAHGHCVDCVTDVDCLDLSTACIGYMCVPITACTSSRMCPGQVCNVPGGYCVDCLTSADCPDAGVCETALCQPPPMACASDRTCTPLGMVCNTMAGHCVECVHPADCTSGNCLADGTCGP